MKILPVIICLVFISNVFALENKNYSARSFKENIIIADSPVDKITDMLKTSIIVIGENHSEYSNHVKELQIIQALYAKNKNIGIGMEMFSRSHQQVINEYINSKISETEFLKQTEYFTEWGFDYQLYKIIVDFVKKNKIDLVGLNIKNDIVRNIGRHGLRGISSEEYNEIPDYIDFSNELYKKSLYEAFLQHQNMDLHQVDNFYFSQLIRDEYMAESAHKYLKQNPDRTIIILAGNGHVEHGYGLPMRLKRISGKDCKTVIIDAVYETGAADYFVYTKDVKMKSSPRLNIMLTMVEKKVVVTGFDEDADEAKSPLKIKDEILLMDETPIHSVADIRLFLFNKSAGDTIKITLSREQEKLTLDFKLEQLVEDP